MGPKPNETEKNRGLTVLQGRRLCEMKAEVGAMPPQAKDGKSHQGLEEARKDPPLETLEGVWPC